MADELYRSYSLEKSKNDDGEIITSGSMTIWEDTPDFPLRIGEYFRPVSSSPLLTVDKLSVKDNVVGTLNGKPVRQWQITIEGKNGEESGSQTENNVKYTFIIADNKKSGTMEVVNTGASPSLRLEVGDTFSVPGIGNVKCTKITGNDEYTDSGTRKWTTVYEWTDGNGESDTKYNFSIERSGDNTISTGSKTVTNSGNSPSNVALAETITVPGVGALPCVKVSGSDDYDENGNHIWTVTHEGSNAPNVTQETHDTKYNISIERNSDNDPITSGSKTVTNSGDTPSNLVLAENLNLPGVGNIPLVKVSASDDYDDDGTRKWIVTYEGSNASTPAEQEGHDTKYSLSIERNGNDEPIITGSKTVTNSGDSPSNLALTENDSYDDTNSGDTPSNLVLDENLTLPGVGDIPLVKVSASDDYDDNGNHVWTVTHEGSNESEITQETHDTRYNYSIEKNGNDEPIITGSKTVTNSGDSPSNLALTETVNLPGIGDIKCTKVSANDSYDDDGTHTWTVTYDASNASDPETQTEHDTKYNFSIERNSDNETVITGSKTVTNSGNNPSSTTLPEKLNLPSIGDINCVRVSGNDDYDDDGTRKWTVTYEGSNASTATQETHDTKYNFSIERNGDNDTIITGSKTVTNSGNSPSSATLPANVNLPGIGNLRCVKVSGSDDYDDDGTHVWTVNYDGSNAPVTTQTEHDTKYNFSIENSNNEVVKTGSKTVIISGNTLPNLSVGETINVPGIGNVKCIKVSGNDGYDDDGTRKWTVVYDCTDAPQEQTTSSNVRYSINIERNSDGVIVYTGTKEITSDSEPTTSTNIGDELTFPLIGSVPCTRIYSNSNSNGTWTLVIECSKVVSEEGGEGQDGQSTTSLPDSETEITYEINGTTARSVAGELIILKRSDTSITKQTVTVYTQDGNSVANPGSSYRGGTCISEHISQETIKNNGVVVSSYFKHVIEVEA